MANGTTHFSLPFTHHPWCITHHHPKSILNHPQPPSTLHPPPMHQTSYIIHNIYLIFSVHLPLISQLFSQISQIFFCHWVPSVTDNNRGWTASGTLQENIIRLNMLKSNNIPHNIIPLKLEKNTVKYDPSKIRNIINYTDMYTQYKMCCLVL